MTQSEEPAEQNMRMKKDLVFAMASIDLTVATTGTRA
jgi:hypothetical protein